ncbi:MAG: 50S ribosomal protein L7/L12 [Capnocytophaga sp.]|nr:MAG: 50S ribosomal protein L7/L12 [Capnocytophaga sp.]
MSKNKIEEIQEFVHQGYKLAAVKALKDASGVDLGQAKDIIDDLFLDNTIDLNARIASAKSHYSENYERISATSDANGSNVHFYYQKGNVKEEVTPGHPMWERVKAQYSHEWEGVPEDIVKAREPFRKAVLEMEAQAGVSGGKREDTLFIKKKSFNIFEGIKWYFILALVACIIYMIWSIWSIFNKA